MTNLYKNKKIYIGLTIVFFLISLIFFGWKQKIFIFSTTIESEIFGQFGDFFGGVLGTIFALISVLFLINTFIQQQLITRENKSLVNTQRFNDLFFELLDLYQSQTKELQDVEEFDKNEDGKINRYKITYNNKDFFDFNMRKIQDSYASQNSYSKNIREAKNSFSKVYLSHKSKLAIYFRTLFRIFDLIENSKLLNETSKKDYSKIIRAQLTEGELFFLRYNAMSYYGHNFIPYLNRYNIFKHLPHFELLEFKSWWSPLNIVERSSVDSLFFIIKDVIKDIYKENTKTKKQIPIPSLKYRIFILLNKDKSNLSIEIIVNQNASNTTNDFAGLDKFSDDKIQALFDCFIKELVLYSNFKKFNKQNHLIFYSEPISTKKSITLIQSGVKNKNNERIVLRFEK